MDEIKRTRIDYTAELEMSSTDSKLVFKVFSEEVILDSVGNIEIEKRKIKTIHIHSEDIKVKIKNLKNGRQKFLIEAIFVPKHQWEKETLNFSTKAKQKKKKI